MKRKIKALLTYLFFFLLIWGAFRLFGPSYMQGEDRKKLIFKSIEYYNADCSLYGIVTGIILVGYIFYKNQWSILDSGTKEE